MSLNINKNNLVYVPYGTNKGKIFKITKVNGDGTFNAVKTEYSKVQILLDEFLRSVSQKDNFNNNSPNVNTLKLVYIPNGKYEGSLLQVIDGGDGGYYAIDIGIKNIKVILSDYLIIGNSNNKELNSSSTPNVRLGVYPEERNPLSTSDVRLGVYPGERNPLRFTPNPNIYINHFKKKTVEPESNSELPRVHTKEFWKEYDNYLKFSTRNFIREHNRETVIGLKQKHKYNTGPKITYQDYFSLYSNIPSTKKEQIPIFKKKEFKRINNI